MTGEEAQRLARVARFHESLVHLVNEGLAQGAGEDFYRHFLRRALDVVPGAQAGGLLMRRGDDRFVLEAVAGYPSEVLEGLSLVGAEVLVWQEDFRPKCIPRYYRREGLLAERSVPAQRRLETSLVTLTVPLRLRGEVVAVLNLDNFDAEDGFGDEAARLAEIFAAQLAVVLQRLGLEQETERRARHAALLAKVGRMLLEFDSLDDFFPRLAELIRAELGGTSHRVGVYRLRGDGHFDCDLYGYPPSLATCVAAVMQRHDPLSESESLFGKVLRTRTPYYCRDVDEEPGWVHYEALDTASFLLLPLTQNAALWGVLDVVSSRKDGFDEADRSLLEGIGAHVQLALSKQLDRDTVRAQLGKLEVVVAANEALRNATQHADVYERSVDILLERTSATQSSLLICLPGETALKVVATRGLYADAARGQNLPKGRGLSWRVVESGQSQHLTDVCLNAEMFVTGPAVAGEFLGSPIINRRGRAIGVLTATSPGGAGFDAGDVSFAEAVAQACSSALTRLELLAQSEREAKAYRALANFGAIIEDINDVDVLMVLGLQQLQTQLGTDFATQFELFGDELRLAKVWGQVPEGFRAVFEARPLRLGEGVAGQAAETGELVYVPNYQGSSWTVPEFLPFGYETLLAIPVRQRGRVASVLTLYSAQEVSLDENRLTIARNFVRRLENALERADNLHEVEATREGTLRALGLALEYRDIETKGHTDRVVGLSTRFGERLGLAPEQLESLRWGAYLHDIGKIAIPDAVLLKPGRLTSVEFETIKRHATIGYRTCRSIPFLPDDTCALVRSHHERFAGGGYPDGLSNEGISLLARVFSLVDVYDALVNKRPYKDAWSQEQALSEIRSLAGVHFDPELVPVFLEVAGEMPAPR